MVRCLASPERTLGTSGFMKTGEFSNATFGENAPATHMAFLFVSYGFLGVVIPTASVLALERYGAIAGTASALMGSIQMVTGAVVMAVAGLFADGAPQPMVIGIAACGVAAFLVAQIVLRRSVKVPASAGDGSTRNP
jgi:DHA1 family bicyclomycin/chloramphenicol resistance-like MFS transporter